MDRVAERADVVWRHEQAGRAVLDELGSSAGRSGDNGQPACALPRAVPGRRWPVVTGKQKMSALCVEIGQSDLHAAHRGRPHRSARSPLAARPGHGAIADDSEPNAGQLGAQPAESLEQDVNALLVRDAADREQQDVPSGSGSADHAASGPAARRVEDVASSRPPLPHTWTRGLVSLAARAPKQPMRQPSAPARDRTADRTSRHTPQSCPRRAPSFVRWQRIRPEPVWYEPTSGRPSNLSCREACRARSGRASRRRESDRASPASTRDSTFVSNGNRRARCSP